MRIYIDLTEFFLSPMRTGIQRVCGELCKFWPREIELVPVTLNGNGELAPLPAKSVGMIAEFFEAREGAAVELAVELKKFAGESVSQNGLLPLRNSERLLVPELFFRPERTAFYSRLDERTRDDCHFIVYDCLPYTNPEYFPVDLDYALVHLYFTMLRRFHKLAFISKPTKQIYYGRMLRDSEGDGPVVRLGSDGLGPKALAPPQSSGLTFVVVGTIEPRKNQELILEAFDRLFATNPYVRLVFIGRLVGWYPLLEARIQAAAVTNSRFEYCPHADDERMRAIIESARATIFVSAAEGFGLPPVESLWLGVPVIASTGIPSLAECGETGLHIIERIDAAHLVQAVSAFFDDSYYQRKASEVRGLELPTWASFASAVAAWVGA